MMAGWLAGGSGFPLPTNQPTDQPPYPAFHSIRNNNLTCHS